jgi:hypothetical protein
LSVLAYPQPVQAYPRSAAWPISLGPGGAYLGAMTTYTTPHFATGVSDRNLQTDPAIERTRPAAAAPYRTAGVSNEAAALRSGPTPDWQPGIAKGGVPKAAIGALGAALVGGVALAIVLMAPSNKVVKQVSPDPIAQATAQNTASQKAVDSSTAAVNELDKNPPAAGTAPAIVAPGTDTATTDTKTTTSTSTTKVESAPAIPAPVQAVIPHAPPVVHEQHHAKATVATPKAVPQPVHSAPAATPDVPAPAPVVTPPADVQAPAMQQTPDAPTVTPAPTPSPTPDTPAPTPVPAPTE